MGFYQMMMDEEDECEDSFLLAYGLTMASQEQGSRRRRALDAPPRLMRERNREEGDAIIRRQYFGEKPIFDDDVFRRR